MSHKRAIDPVTAARVIADTVEHLGQELRRTVAAVEGIVKDLKDLHELVSPLLSVLTSTLTSPPARVQTLVSAKER